MLTALRGARSRSRRGGSPRPNYAYKHGAELAGGDDALDPGPPRSVSRAALRSPRPAVRDPGPAPANPPLAPNQIDIDSTIRNAATMSNTAVWWTFKDAEHNMPRQLATVMTQPEYSAIIAGVNAAIDEGNVCVGWLILPTAPLCLCYYLCVAKPETIKSINEKLQPFRDKGIQAEYLIGQHGNPSRLSCIRLTLPAPEREVTLPSGALGISFEAGSTKVIKLHEGSPLRGLVQPGERIVAFAHADGKGGRVFRDCTSGWESTDKGLVAMLNAHKHEPGRSVTVRGNAHLGQTSQTFHVQVPPGAGPGQTLQAQAPNGVTLQVQIPQGSAPGTTFEVATPAMPVDVTVAPPTAQVSPAPMEMERAI